jgi:hypothetical protein
MSTRTAAAIELEIEPAGKPTDAVSLVAAAPVTASEIAPDEGLSTVAAAVPASASLISGRSGISDAGGSTDGSGAGSAGTAKFVTATVAVFTIPVAVCVRVAVTVALPREEAV